MKQAYVKPELDVRTYAQFENVFTFCDKGNEHSRGCKFAAHGNPGRDSPWTHDHWARHTDPTGS